MTNINKYLFLAVLLVALLHNTCFGRDEFLKGEITERVFCLADSSQVYALYLPKKYTDAQSWPVLFFFEPMARAMLPLEKYCAYAEKFGVILVCSYNSRNGPNQPIFDAANAMYADVNQRFRVDEQFLTLSGFSGGARISCLMGLSNDKIRSVIGCGAGFPYSNFPREQIPFNYFGIIGKQDMNYLEMCQLDSTLSSFGNNHGLAVFPQGHQWPDTASFKRAFFWLECHKMRSNRLEIDNSLLREIRQDIDQQLNEARDNKLWVDCTVILENAIKLLDGLANVNDYKNSLLEIRNREAYRQQLLQSEKNRTEELSWQKKYHLEFEQISLRGIDPDHPVKPASWWKKEFRKISVLEDSNRVARLNEFLINGSWEQHTNAKRHGAYNVALAFLLIYETGLPESPSPPYLKSVVYALSGNSKEMYKALNKALDLGLHSADLLKKEKAYDPYRNSKKFQCILESLPDGGIQ